MTTTRVLLCFVILCSCFLLLQAQYIVTYYRNNTAGNLQTSEVGGSSVLQFMLSSPPNVSVQVYIESTNASAGFVYPQILTFDASNWNITKNVVITGLNNSVNGASYTNYGISAITQSDDPNWSRVRSYIPVVNQNCNWPLVSSVKITGVLSSLYKLNLWDKTYGGK
eukprot:TRINITY_DN3342_c0_g1_i1.p1 TRINITY_DN3342_c0_g1~~TRINITY_DN3342_c0_g1_i1.p1  ORF type:complete len:167 (-),score=9.74 TRINITY_DN3342_c0_g1_i1:92-592(-)